jgi:hypothetical protein
MAELPLHGGDISGARHHQLTHRVPGAVRRPPLHPGRGRDLVPHVVDDLSGEAAVPVRVSVGRQEEGGVVLPLLGILRPLPLRVVAKGF